MCERDRESVRVSVGERVRVGGCVRERVCARGGEESCKDFSEILILSAHLMRTFFK